MVYRDAQCGTLRLLGYRTHFGDLEARYKFVDVGREETAVDAWPLVNESFNGHTLG